MNQHDIVIVGAGPGGIQLALTLGEIKARTGADFTYRVVERANAPGSFFKKFPVHGMLISNNKLYSGRDPKSQFSERFDWNSLITEDREILTRNYSRDFYPRREIICTMLNDLCERYDVPVDYDTAVERIARDADGGFSIETNREPIRARNVVLATGLKPKVTTIPGIEHATPYAEMKPASHYRDQQVLIIGKGNSAFECAKDILNEASIIMLASPSPVRFAYKTHYVGSVRSVNDLLVENYQLKHHAAILDCDVKSIERAADGYRVSFAYKHANQQVETLRFDAVIAATGFIGDLDALDPSLTPARMHGKFPEIEGHFECPGVDGLYFAGALTHGRDYRTFSSSGFIHGFRYNSMILARHLAEKFGAVEQAPRIVPEKMTSHLLDALDTDAGIYLQPGYIGLCYRLAGDGAWTNLCHQPRHWFEVEPVKDTTLMLMTIEYGDIHAFPDVMQIPRLPGDPEYSPHIHPVLRVRSAAGAKEFHLEESLLNRFENIVENRSRLDRFLSGYSVPQRAVA